MENRNKIKKKNHQQSSFMWNVKLSYMKTLRRIVIGMEKTLVRQ
ncbi:hypothetical protein [Clostridium beijerinckii]|nr:hypothetical protein [Clostridium beijerinckii]NRW56196.1 hypothetical protein [Clostridium beijerinckii]NRZ92467.1 hypothetical protein [Clostridium beijerinckii]